MSYPSYSEHSKLAEARKLRKRVDEDAKLLSNRLALLKQEEQKALKKIEETRKRAHDIIDSRNKNIREAQKRDYSRRLKEEEESSKVEQRKLESERVRAMRQQVNKYRAEQMIQEIKSIKVYAKSNTRDAILNEELTRKIIMKNKIKDQEREAEEKRKKYLQDKLERTKNDFLKKAEQENKNLTQV